MGRAGILGRMLLLGGRVGCGAPGIATGLAGRAVGSRGRPAGRGAVAGRAIGMEGAGGAAAREVPWKLALCGLDGRGEGTRGFGIEGARRPRGGFGVFGRPGTRLISGRLTSGPIATTGGASGLLPPPTAKSEARVACAGLGFGGGSDLAGSGGATLDASGGVSTGGRGSPAGRTVGGRERTGGRKGPIGGRNDLPPPATGMVGRSDAADARTLRPILRPRMGLERFRNGSSSSVIATGGSARLRSLILSRTLSAVASSNELEWDLGSSMPKSGSTAMISLDLTSNSRASSLMRIVLLLFALFRGRASRRRCGACSDIALPLPC